MAGSLTKVEAFATQMWLKIQLLETLAKVGGLDNCSLLVSKQLKALIMNVVPKPISKLAQFQLATVLYSCDDTYRAKFEKQCMPSYEFCVKEVYNMVGPNAFENGTHGEICLG